MILYTLAFFTQPFALSIPHLPPSQSPTPPPLHSRFACFLFFFILPSAILPIHPVLLCSPALDLPCPLSMSSHSVFVPPFHLPLSTFPHFLHPSTQRKCGTRRGAERWNTLVFSTTVVEDKGSVWVGVHAYIAMHTYIPERTVYMCTQSLMNICFHKINTATFHLFVRYTKLHVFIHTKIHTYKVPVQPCQL